jgi:Ca2+-binding EF-hand superfamily protein
MNMKRMTLATLLAAAMLAVVPPVAMAQKGMDNIKAMDKDKDGMISKAEFMAMMEKAYNDMDKAKKGRLTAQDVAASIQEIYKTYGSAN